jgi:hypothetical protein
MTALKSNAERLQRLYEAFDSDDLEEAAYESPAEALEATERGHADA